MPPYSFMWWIVYAMNYIRIVKAFPTHLRRKFFLKRALQSL